MAISLAGGTYRLTHSLALGPEDSGAKGHNLVFTAEPGQHPVISGSVRVIAWKKFDTVKNIWSAPLPPGVSNSRQLYIDGVRATRTRGRLPVVLTMTDTGYTAANATMASWKHPSDLEFVYTGGNSVWSEAGEGLGSWTEPRCPAASIEGATITMQQPCWDNSTQRVMLPSGARTANLVGPKSVGKQPAYVENAFELLGTPGQFYIDREAHEIYYTPRPGEDLTTADVELPVIETLIDAHGTATDPVHNIVFSGIEFSYATWLGPNGPDGFSEIQAGYQVTGPEGYSKQGLCSLVPGGMCPYGAWTKEPANVSLRFAHNIRFTGDAFVHLGAAGLDLGEGAQNDVVEGSVFTDISGNGLELASVDKPLAPEAEFAVGNHIENNLFEDVGAEYRGGIAIVIGYARDTLVSHNQIDHIPYAGISIGWGGWPDKIEKAGQANNSARNVISDNLIHEDMLVLSDGGGIYTQGLTGTSLADGERVTGNVVYNQYSSGHAIYSDNGSSMMTIIGNVMFHTDHDNWGSRHRNWYDGNDGKNFDPLVIEDNYWQQGDADSSKENVTERDNHLINALSEVPAGILQNAGLEPAFRDLTDQHFAKAAPPEPPSRVAAWAGNGYADVTWSPSIAQGGSPVDAYIVRASNGAEARISNADFWKYAYVKVPDLANGKTLTFTVSAVNRQGTSVASMPSLPVTPSDAPVAPPGAPQNVSVHSGKGAVSIHFQLPPAGHGESESPVLAYAITVNPGGRKVVFTGRNIVVLEGRHVTFNVVDGLTSGAAYTFSVAAVNNAGEGTPVTVGPVTIP
ncbi:MAG TPA: right-handed parallel beta-helix repeat-containing protein [Terracidiphilus sp.]|nr:right-handed parallel beta-helix repeat-containing protein [Terracidiphilus sp.]